MKNVLFFALLFLPGFAFEESLAQTVVESVHNLSATGPGMIRASTESEVCIFCHTPHSSKPDSPLWNKNDPGVFYELYNSSTRDATPGQPAGASLLCLSCHDGTIALGNILSRTSDIDFSGGITQMPAGATNLGTDLSDDHPVSFLYNSALVTADGQLEDPSDISFPVSLDNGYVECTSCHDPHNDKNPDFLVLSNKFSKLCLECHLRSYWGTSSHSTSTATWNGTVPDPWPHTSFTYLAENACENCHNPHSAEGKFVLLNALAEENNCLNCHNGNVASSNIVSELSKTYLHQVYDKTLIHDPSENPLVSSMHVECQDCHNPHAVNDASATAPDVSGKLTGVKGVTIGGSPLESAFYQYEICFRCHSSNSEHLESYTNRQIDLTNTMSEFNTGNPSYHPVAGVGKNPAVPSLLTSHTVNSIIYCTDCHASSGGEASSGPHGSEWPGLLKYRYETADNTIESAENYALCYSCHSRASILADESFGSHNNHITLYLAPCNACHDPHGIPPPGTAINNSNLINFDTDIVFPTGGSANLKFEDTGLFSGYCMLRCHGQGHGPGMNY